MIRKERQQLEELLQSIRWIKCKVGKVFLRVKKENKVAILKLESWEDKFVLMRYKNTIHGKEVFIDHDLTQKEGDVQRMLNHSASRKRREERAAKEVESRGAGKSGWRSSKCAILERSKCKEER